MFWSRFQFEHFSLIVLAAGIIACTSSEERPGDLDTSFETDTTSAPPVCHDVEDFKVLHSPVNIMFLQDISSSMLDESKWTISKAVLSDIFDKWTGPEFRFGYDLFPPIVGATFSPNPLDYCDTTPDFPYEGDTGVTIDCNQYNQQEILELQAQIIPDQETPLWCAMQNFLGPTYAPAFSELSIPSFLVVISDGADSCGSTCEGGFQDTDRTPVDADDFAALATDLLGNLNIQSVVIGFGDQVDTDVLSTIAENGTLDTDFANYQSAEDEKSLEKAFNYIINNALSCELAVGEEVIDHTLVNVHFTAKETDKIETIGFDENCHTNTGWTWMNAEHTGIRLCKQACEELDAAEGALQVKATFGCDVVIVQ